MTDRPDDIAEIQGTGARLAAWTIAAIDGGPVAADGLDEVQAKQLRRVTYAVDELRRASRERAAGPTT